MVKENSKRPILPIVVIPLDEFGSKIVRDFEEVVGLVEPGLIDLYLGPVSALPLWSTEKGEVYIRTIMEKLTLMKNIDCPYESATPFFPSAFVFVVGSLSLGFERCLEHFSEFLAAIDSSGLKNQMRIIPIFDISWFPADGINTTSEAIEALSKFEKAKALKEFYYLVEAQTEWGVRAKTREEIAEAIKIYLEAITLSDLWGNYKNLWLCDEDRPKGNGVEFASFSVLSFVSPYSELIKYLSNVTYNQIVSEIDESEPAFEEEDFFQLPVVGQIQRVLDDSRFQKDVQVLPKYPFFENKENYAEYVETEKLQFYTKFIEWREELVQFLYTDQKYFNDESIQVLKSYDENLEETFLDWIKKGRFIRRARVFIEGGKKTLISSVAEKAVEWKLPEKQDIQAYLDNEYAKIAKLIDKLPNFSSLFIHFFVMVVFYFVGVRRLIPYVSISHDIKVDFWILTGLYFLYTIFALYLAWRLPTWRIKYAIKKSLLPAQKAIFNRYLDSFHEIYRGISEHWHQKNLTNSKFVLSNQIHNIETVVRYMERSREIEEQNYPYPEINWKKIMSSLNGFRVFIEENQDIKDMGKSKHIESQVILKGINLIEDQIGPIFVDGTPELLEQIIRNIIRQKYSEQPVADEMKIKERMGAAVAGYSSMQDKPLIRSLNPLEGKNKKSQFYCSCNEMVWEELEKVENIQKSKEIHVIDLNPKDRIYFFRTWYGIHEEDLTS